MSERLNAKQVYILYIPFPGTRSKENQVSDLQEVSQELTKKIAENRRKSQKIAEALICADMFKHERIPSFKYWQKWFQSFELSPCRCQSWKIIGYLLRG